MLGRPIARLVVLLLFVAQGLAPFVHAHAGASLPATGDLLHLHLPAQPSAALASDDGPRWQADLGQVVGTPPEVRRDAALRLADPPTVAPAPYAPVVADDARRHAAPEGAPAAVIPSSRRHSPLARGPPLADSAAAS